MTTEPSLPTPTTGAMYVDPGSNTVLLYDAEGEAWKPCAWEYKVLIEYPDGGQTCAHQGHDQGRAQEALHAFLKVQQPYLHARAARVLLLRRPITPWLVANVVTFEPPPPDVA